VKAILQNELYIGKQFYNKTVEGRPLSKDEWEIYYHDQVIIEVGVYNSAQRYLLESRDRHYHKNIDNRKYLLHGLLKCANCYDPTKHTKPYPWHGVPQRVKSTGKKTYYYECSTKNSRKRDFRGIECKAIPIPAIPLEEHVINFIKELLNNPEVVFKYQQKLQSKKNEIGLKRSQLNSIKKLLNSHPAARERIIELYKSGDIDSKRKREDLDNEDTRYRALMKEMQDLERELSVFTGVDEYIKAFKAFQINYASALGEINQSYTEDDWYSLVHMIIDEIIVFSRPKRKTDSISGPKKEGQMVPYKLNISLKIPSEMLKDLLFKLSPESKLEAEKEKWWAM